jgi:hypothetical protein
MTNQKNENINSINSIKTTKSTNCIKSMVILVGDPTTKPFENPATPGPVGPRNQESQKEGIVVESAPKPNLADERTKLQENNQWITQDSVDYIQVDIWPQPNVMGNYTDFKIVYSFKTVGNFDLRSNKFSSKLTRRHNDYYGYVRDKWANIQGWVYEDIRDVVKLINKQGGEAHAGRCSVNRGVRKGVEKSPILPYTSILLCDNRPDEEWCCSLWHHGFEVKMSVPQWEWLQAYEEWLKEYGIKKDFKKKVPPMTRLTWRKQ